MRCTLWVQWQLHRQLARASAYAAARRVALKGDLPIGVDKRSVDTWVEVRAGRGGRAFDLGCGGGRVRRPFWGGRFKGQVGRGGRAGG